MKYWSIILFGLTLSACEQLIKIETPEALNLIVVESVISNETKPWFVRITKTQAFYDQDSASGIADAQVIISDNIGNADTLFHLSNGNYRSVNSRQCIPGQMYTLDIYYGGKQYSATELCRFQYPIDTFTAYYLPENNGFIEKGWYVFESAKEWESPGDFYEWKLYCNDTLQDMFGIIVDEDRFRESSFFNLKIDPADPLAGIDEGILPRPFPFRYDVGDTLFLEQYCINQGYYNFLLERQNQLNRTGTPFDPPPANPVSNISNGALGYFSVVNKVTAKTIITE